MKPLIARAVRSIIQQYYPDKYCSLCHVFAVVGSNVASIMLDRHYRPVAGLAVVDCGGGEHMPMLDNTAFGREEGGAFHCWIESAEPAPGGSEVEVLDFTFSHNAEYVVKNGGQWRLPPPPPFLWGPRSEVALDAQLHALPAQFPPGMLWLDETPEGRSWMSHHIADNQRAYITLTAEALKLLQSWLPTGAALPLTDSAPASAPDPVC